MEKYQRFTYYLFPLQIHFLQKNFSRKKKVFRFLCIVRNDLFAQLRALVFTFRSRSCFCLHSFFSPVSLVPALWFAVHEKPI